jgi:nitronate monooxygenase
MAGAQDSRLAVAVAHAGGLGSIPAAMLEPDGLRQELAAVRLQTAAAIAVNFFCHVVPDADLELERAWRDTLAPYFDELGLDRDAITQGPTRRPFGVDALQVLGEYRPEVVSFHFGLPEDVLLAPLRSWGARIVATATTLAEAQWLVSRGVDAIVAQGIEAGGHRGMFLTDDLSSQIATIDLVHELVRHVDVPVIAAGGIMDAAGTRRALAAGAVAVQVGTAYLLCDEAATSPVHRAAIASPDARHTELTRLFSGRPARGIVNRLMRELNSKGLAVPPFPLAATALAPLRSAAERLGRPDFSPLWAGIGVAACRRTDAGTLTRQLCDL